MSRKAKKTTGKKATARKKPARRPTSSETPVELDDRREEVQQDYAGLREKSATLEGRYSDLEEAHHELRDEHVELKERARIIDERYTELVERTDEGSAPAAIQISPIELEAMRDELRQLRQEREAREAAPRIACPKCGAGLEELTHEGVTIDRCPACGGVYLDKGELERVMAKREPGGFFQRLGALFA